MKIMTLQEAAEKLGAVAVAKMMEGTGSDIAPGSLATAADTTTGTDPAGAWSEDPEGNPLLIEGSLYYRQVEVTLPGGDKATFRLASAGMGAGQRVLVHIYPPVSRFANVFRYSPEGTHQFIGRAARMEKGGEA